MFLRTSLAIAFLLFCLPDFVHGEEEWASARKRMVAEIAYMGVLSPQVLYVMREIPRHEFIPKRLWHSAYDNHPLPIGLGQTISQPYIVAYMTEALRLKKTDKVLEIGTGSGYQAAVLSRLVQKVFSIEIIEELGEGAKKTFQKLKYDNIEVKIGDGYHGWPEKAPFDAIILTAAAPKIPKPLTDQLAEGGRLIAPVGKSYQELVLITKKGKKLQKERLLPVRFVPMTGEVND